MYSKSGSTHAPHCWIPSAPLVMEISNVLVQLFWHNEYEESVEYLSFSEHWSLSCSQQGQLNKCFALLSSPSLLCLLRVSSEAFSQSCMVKQMKCIIWCIGIWPQSLKQ